MITSIIICYSVYIFAFIDRPKYYIKNFPFATATWVQKQTKSDV
jgi:hypothetical protein